MQALAVSEKEAARLLGISFHTLRRLRLANDGPQHYWARGRICYPVASVARWAEQRAQAARSGANGAA
jgi:hypothetical protein